jgi:diadenosine tetraphosphate (Ap4A) HIT family hydrolase
MTNATTAKFGYPATLIREFDHWVMLVRPAQVTLGSLVLAATSEATAYGDLPAEAFAEQGRIVAAMERAVRDFSRYQRINYLMLMMVDPHVHFHVIPRYEGSRRWLGMDFPDRGWPGPPDLKSAVSLDAEQIAGLVAALQDLVDN